MALMCSGRKINSGDMQLHPCRLEDEQSKRIIAIKFREIFQEIAQLMARVSLQMHSVLFAGGN